MMTDPIRIQGVSLSNFLFLSQEVIIEHAKMSIKLDNNRERRARISFRLILSSESDRSDPVLYVLIKNMESSAKYIGAEEDYNQRLEIGQFRRAAGAYGFREIEKSRDFSIFAVDDLPEAPLLQGEIIIHPKNITCEYLNYGIIPDFLRSMVNTRDIVLRIKIVDVEEILCKLNSTRENASMGTSVSACQNNGLIWIFQFRISLQDFVPEGTKKCWESSNKSWSIDFNIHKRRNYEDLIDRLEEDRLLVYPKSLELWFTIPHLHQFVASSPVYEKAFIMKSEDLAYKRVSPAEEGTAVAEFETQEGDYSVKIVNKSKDFVEFSVICTSPFLPAEKPEELSRKIRDFERKAPQFVQREDIMYPFGLFLAFLTLIYAIISVFLSGLGENQELRLTLFTVVAAAIFFGVSVWGISMLCYILVTPQDVRTRLKTVIVLLTENTTRTKFLTIGIVIAVAILTVGLIIVLRKDISSLLNSLFVYVL
jgi:hypothetical protein